MTFGAPRNSARRSARGEAPDAQDQDALRIRARRRLIGAVALVLLGVIVFPLVFDAKPKPVPSTIALDIPSQTKAPGLAMPASAPMLPAASAAAVPSAPPHEASTPAGDKAAVTSAPVAQPTPTIPSAAAKPQPTASAAAPVATLAAAPAAPKPVASKPAAKAAPAPQPATQPTPQHAKELANARQALAALEGKSPQQISLAQAEAALARKNQATPDEATPSKTRYVVQAGAFADAHAAQVVRAKIEKAGFKTYTQVVDTPQGKRVRVRVGPFGTRDDAEHALHKLQALGLSGAVLTL